MTERKDERTLADLAREAIAVQNACNLSGVLHSYYRTVLRLRELVGGSSEASARHPICQLWADKVASLTGVQSFDVPLSEAYRAVYALRDGAPSTEPVAAE